MQRARAECTVTPTGESLEALCGVLAGPVQLVGADGQVVAVPAEVHRALAEVVQALADDQAVTVSPHRATVRTQEAADLWGVSRPTLVRLLDQGAIPCEQPGRHRWVRLTDLLDYQRRRRDHDD